MNDVVGYVYIDKMKGCIFVKLAELRRITKQSPIPNSADEQQDLIITLKQGGIELSTIYQELEMAGEFVEAHHDSSFPNATVCLHSHDFYELLYCCNTCGVEYLVGTSRYRLKKGDIVWVAPGMSHRPLIPADAQAAYHRDVIWISRKFMDELVCPFASGDLGRRGRSGLMRTAGTEWEFLGDHFHNCVRESEQKNLGWQMAMMGNVMMLVSGLSRCESKAGLPLPAEAPELLDQVMDYIEAHYSEHITLADTAARFYVSGSTISNLFRQKMGASFYRCVTQRRLIAAKDLIRRGVAMESVNEQVGFRDYSGFYRAFKQEYGLSPRQFRQLQERSAGGWGFSHGKRSDTTDG